ncbi:MAG: hypothetical protein ABR906_04060 [Terracidiphilus sp.]
MRKIAAFLLAFLLFPLAAFALSEVEAIHADRLPQETAVLAALDDTRQLEPYCYSYTPDWKYSIAKADVVARLGKDLSSLNLALKDHPDNAELLLLTGLVARFAYNLDAPGSYEAALKVLGQTQKLAPSDIRAPWFRATLLCQTAKPTTGAEQMLDIESSHAWDQLPAAFWDDYMECATVADMPVHFLRALDHSEKLHAPSLEARDVIADATRKRFDPFDPKKEYEPKKVWQAVKVGDDPQFTSTTCGARLRARGDWHIDRLEVTNGSCVAQFRTGPYKATVNKRTPNVLLLVQQPKENESLQEYSKKFLKSGTFEPYSPANCPAATCIALKGIQPESYKEDGGGRSRIVIFERDQPEFPGLIFETPQTLPKSDDKTGVQAYHPGQIQQRMPGKLYYLVLVDTATSIEEPAMKDFDFFLKNLTVE